MADLFELSAVLGLDTNPYIKALSGVIGITTKALSGLTDLAVDFGKSIIETGLKFDEAMSGVFAVTQTTDELNRKLLETAAISEASASSFTTAEVAMAEYYEGLAGFTNEEIVAGLHAIVVAAEASGESLPLVSDILTDVTRAFGDGADEMTHYADVLAATATSTNTTIGQMGQALKYVAPIAGSLGFKIEDVALSLGIMADRGTKASQAGTTLRNIFTRIATNAGSTEKDLGALEVLVRKLGVSFYDSSDNVRPWVEILEDARAAWHGLNEEDKNEVLDAVAAFAVNGRDADEVLKNLTKDADYANNAFEKFKNATDDSERESMADRVREIASSYSELFKILGMNVDPATDEIGALANAITQARIKLAGLTDEEKIYFSRQISSMRGMTGWLELMEATEESFVSVKEAIFDALGAADEMRNIRLGSNLWGDITQFGAAWDAMLTTIYNDVDGPMREVVQWATSAIQDITKAIGENGLAGGFEKLSEKIRDLAEDEHFKELLSSVGKLIVPVLDEVIDDLIPSIAEAAPKIASTFLKSIGDAMAENGDGPGGALGVLTWLVGEGLQITGAITGYFRKIGEESGAAMSEEIVGQFDPTIHPENVVPFNDWLTAGGDPTMIPDGIYNATIEKAPEIQQALSDTLSDAGTDGGRDMGTNAATQLAYAEQGMRDGLVDVISDAGDPIGRNIANDIYNHLISTPFRINVSANVSNMPIARRNDFSSVQSSIGLKNNFGSNFISDMVNNAINKNMGGQEIVIPRSNSVDDGGRNSALLIVDGTVAGRLIYRLYNEEDARVGVKLAGGVL